jgi:AAA domain
MSNERILSVADGHVTVGSITERDGIFIAYDATGALVGRFTTQTEAARAASNGNFHRLEGRPARPIAIRTAADLRCKTFDPIKYIVPGYIVEGCTILAGRPKLGKSWLMLDVGLAVARGDHCLGNVKCEQGDVLYLALEDNQRRLQNRMTRIMGYAHSWPERFHYATDWPRAEDGGLDQIRKWIETAERPRLVVVDVLAMFRSPRRKDQQPYEADYAAIQGLQAIASQTGVAIVVVHHLRKSAGELDPLEKVSGTLGLSGAADTVLILDRDAQGMTLYGRGRDIEEIETAVQFSRETCRWRVLGQAVEVRRSDERSLVLKLLREADEPMAPKDIMLAAELTNRNAVDLLLYKMAKAGEIERAGRGLYATPGKIGKIAEETSIKSRLAEVEQSFRSPIPTERKKDCEPVTGIFLQLEAEKIRLKTYAPNLSISPIFSRGEEPRKDLEKGDCAADTNGYPSNLSIFPIFPGG